MPEPAPVEAPASNPEGVIHNIRRGLYDAGTQWRQIGEEENKWGLKRYQIENPTLLFVMGGLVAASLQQLALSNQVNSLAQIQPDWGIETIRAVTMEENAKEPLRFLWYNVVPALSADLIEKNISQLPPNFMDQFKYFLGTKIFDLHSNLVDAFVGLNKIIYDGKPVALTNIASLLYVTAANSKELWTDVTRRVKNPITLGLLKLTDRADQKVPLSSTLKYAGMVMQKIGLPPTPPQK